MVLNLMKSFKTLPPKQTFFIKKKGLSQEDSAVLKSPLLLFRDFTIE